MKTISLLGSTGSVGRNCLKVVEELPGEFRVIALAAGRNTTELADQVGRFHPELVSVSTQGQRQRNWPKISRTWIRPPIRRSWSGRKACRGWLPTPKPTWW